MTPGSTAEKPVILNKRLARKYAAAVRSGQPFKIKKGSKHTIAAAQKYNLPFIIVDKV